MVLWVVVLDYEVGDYVMEDQFVIEVVFDQVYEVGYGQWCFVGEQFDFDWVLGGVESGDEGYEDFWCKGECVQLFSLYLFCGGGVFDYWWSFCFQLG